MASQLTHVKSHEVTSCRFIELVLAANHWVITSFTKLGDAAVTLTSGSGSFIEACMRLGRSCLALEIDGVCSLVNLLLEVQFNASAQRMNEVEAALK